MRGHDAAHPGVHDRGERREVARTQHLHRVAHGRQREVRVGVGRAVTREVLGARRDTAALEALWKRALQLNAAACILSHNHPSGVAEPSQADRRITERLKEALDLVGVRVLDHLVVGVEDIVSFAERGWV